ncbi:MAG: amino acid--tRNA ligase-related protein [Patescibacteria group bacterium]
MLGPYSAKIKDGKRIIEYKGNKRYKKIENVLSKQFDLDLIEKRMDEIVSSKHYFHLHKIDTAIFYAVTEYFKKHQTEWCNLPLTTMMISSPGEIYAGKTLDYTTDALPVDISWFNNSKKAFLSESSQFYLELRLLIKKVDRVFSIYNSFRKEKADYSHLSEFQHVEFEGKVDFKENLDIAYGILDYITLYLLKNNIENLEYFLTSNDIGELKHAFKKKNLSTIPFKEAMEILYADTKDERYKEFSLKHFGGWEEIRLTELLGKNVAVTDFPILQIPFYHNVLKKNTDGISIAENADIVLMGYREVIGSGVRISEPAVLAEKARVFNLPLEDYEPYLKTRDYKHYKATAGFGLGWQRYVQWLLKLPYIWEAVHIPRGEHLPKP